MPHRLKILVIIFFLEPFTSHGLTACRLHITTANQSHTLLLPVVSSATRLETMPPYRTTARNSKLEHELASLEYHRRNCSVPAIGLLSLARLW